MNKQSTTSRNLIAIGMLCFLLGGIAWVIFALIFTGYERLAIPIAAILAAVGAAVLIFNAIIHPESIPRPDVRPSKIDLSPNIGGYQGQHINHIIVKAEVPDIINVGKWPIVRMFKGNNKPLTVRGRIHGICCLLWIATLAVYMLVSFHTGQWEITWIIFLGAAFIHTLIYILLSIGEK